MRLCVCLCVRERENAFVLCVGMCVYERERAYVPVGLCCVCVCVCVCERERESEREREREKNAIRGESERGRESTRDICI